MFFLLHYYDWDAQQVPGIPSHGWPGQVLDVTHFAGPDAAALSLVEVQLIATLEVHPSYCIWIMKPRDPQICPSSLVADRYRKK